MSNDEEETVAQGMSAKEMKVLFENREDIEQALKLKKIIDYSLLALIMFDVTVLSLYVLTFAMMKDHAWFDWLDLVHVFLVVVMIMCIADTLNIYRNLKYLLILGLFFFAIDIIISSFLRPLTIENSNPFNERKIELKRVLMVMQALLTVTDFIAFALSVYFRYGSSLKFDEVHNRYVDIELARQKYMKTSILYFLAAEGQEIRATELQRRIDKENETIALHNRIDEIRKSSSAAAGSGAGEGMYLQRKYDEMKDNYAVAVNRRNVDVRSGAAPVPKAITFGEVVGNKKTEENKRVVAAAAAVDETAPIKTVSTKMMRHQRHKAQELSDERSYLTKFDSNSPVL